MLHMWNVLFSTATLLSIAGLNHPWMVKPWDPFTLAINFSTAASNSSLSSFSLCPLRQRAVGVTKTLVRAFEFTRKTSPTLFISVVSSGHVKAKEIAQVLSWFVFCFEARAWIVVSLPVTKPRRTDTFGNQRGV